MSDYTDILTSIFLPPRGVPLGTQWTGRFLYMLVYAWVRTPPLGCRPTADVQRAGFWAWSPQWAVNRVLPPSLALSGSLQVGAWINRHLQSAGVEKAMAPFCFSVFSVPPPFCSPLGLIPTLLSFCIQETPCWVTFFTTTCLLCVPTSGLRFPLAPLQKGQLRDELGWAGQSAPEATSQ